MKLALPVGMRPMIQDERATIIPSAFLAGASLFPRKCPVSELDDPALGCFAFIDDRLDAMLL
jgi:hypothetical protein